MNEKPASVVLRAIMDEVQLQMQDTIHKLAEQNIELLRGEYRRILEQAVSKFTGGTTIRWERDPNTFRTVITLIVEEK